MSPPQAIPTLPTTLSTGPGALWRCGFPGTYNAAVNTLVGSTLVGNTLVGSTLVGSTLVGSMLETSEQVWDKVRGQPRELGPDISSVLGSF